jgi:pyruvate kinase
LSFVRTADDINTLKRKIEQAGKNLKVIAKIEKPEALKNIDEIIEVTDGLMVARGDLGVEIAMEEVPMVQKMLIAKCNKAAKPVIVATQMLESMIENPRPTRAEANDVANAVMDGADAVMLSAESASGKYPAEAVKSMNNIIASAEKSPSIYYKFFSPDKESSTFIHDSLVLSACQLSKELGAKAILGMTKSGYTGFKLAHHRPKANIFIFTSNMALLNKINLIWGVRGFYYDKMASTDDTFRDLEHILIDKGHLTKGDIFINTASMPIHWEGRTNILKVNIVQ